MISGTPSGVPHTFSPRAAPSRLGARGLLPWPCGFSPWPCGFALALRLRPGPAASRPGPAASRPGPAASRPGSALLTCGPAFSPGAPCLLSCGPAFSPGAPCLPTCGPAFSPGVPCLLTCGPAFSPGAPCLLTWRPVPSHLGPAASQLGPAPSRPRPAPSPWARAFSPWGPHLRPGPAPSRPGHAFAPWPRIFSPWAHAKFRHRLGSGSPTPAFPGPPLRTFSRLLSRRAHQHRGGQPRSGSSVSSILCRPRASCSHRSDLTRSLKHLCNQRANGAHRPSAAPRCADGNTHVRRATCGVPQRKSHSPRRMSRLPLAERPSLHRSPSMRVHPYDSTRLRVACLRGADVPARRPLSV